MHLMDRFSEDLDKMWSWVHRWGLAPAAEEPSLLGGGKEEIKDPDSFSGQQVGAGGWGRYFLLYDFQFPQ